MGPEEHAIALDRGAQRAAGQRIAGGERGIAQVDDGDARDKVSVDCFEGGAGHRGLTVLLARVHGEEEKRRHEQEPEESSPKGIHHLPACRSPTRRGETGGAR